jgi:hypothetical protein
MPRCLRSPSMRSVTAISTAPFSFLSNGSVTVRPAPARIWPTTLIVVGAASSRYGIRVSPVSSRSVRGRAHPTSGNRQARNQICARICARDAAGPLETGRLRGTRKTHVARTPRSARISKTARDGRDGRRSAHNPEVAGSNPAPAIKSAGQRPLPIMGGAFCMSFVNGLVNGPLFTPLLRSPRLMPCRPSAAGSRKTRAPRR